MTCLNYLSSFDHGVASNQSQATSSTWVLQKHLQSIAYNLCQLRQWAMSSSSYSIWPELDFCKSDRLHLLQACLHCRAPHVGREADRGADRDAPPPRERREEPPPRPREHERERERPANGHRDSYGQRDATPRCVQCYVLCLVQ